MRLENKVAIVTGAASGIGEAIAKRFLNEGAKVVCCDMKETCSITHENSIYVKADLTKEDETENVVKKSIENFGKLNIVVNCAGVTGVGSLETTALSDFKFQFDVNVNGVFNMCKSSISELKKQKGASIVNIGSDLGVRPIPERIAYCPSKAAVLMLTKCIAMEYAPYVRANAVLPGLVETPMLKERFDTVEDADAFRNEMANLYPLKRMGTTDDMANAVVYLASDESSFMTGENLGVCGGSLI
ncbi:2,5-dichloro-2,5-cyclohexadiene-1,4-diol dehydrogenase [Candidatus Epulonipiscium fishelsonii]|uniref:2,5-dichloro-2,5-cyclohexadiene-1,4-diol dehydrogenase n=1 Tax=Candidatus Epulonipiscium fishelsonii TaxID=77094 RepID=A0ACC8XBJ2_9FIRM|nr:2,5-dichloro-2,5-cyclohexadiene-1,4-diol dehydrogenase [Epulopiscium sp. SCG-B11WGA-EpuloA1]ONI41303.1 2,5-dichloro-2,5-cyclohexadiene-1,4-diol dehydrogenase [Epulopiscium sp. SCG-B05WGA-EpuloA1]ONI47728.1 2,5-dichloro-2,5-cyclohexadiene-1,4-diol dehydrogenase [Epulopiscium sp. SCG-C06WGA-EpuloA1]